MKALIGNFLRNEAGTTAIEYALIGVLISVAVIAGIGALAIATGNNFDAIGAHVAHARGG
jgi:pilus assembly protein Flp/PilA